MLSQYADGLLEPTPARELEGLLAETPALQAELKQIKDENALLEEALAPLRSSQSARMRVSDAMVNVHRQATTMAESLPERGWRIFRLAFCFASLVGATLLVQFRPPSMETLSENGVYLVLTASVFCLGNVFLLWGGALAQMEARMTSMLKEYTPKPSALEVLMVQVFGAATMLGAIAMYWWMV
jgi:hypothetical protein